jgi:hypothetical protein
VVRSGIDLPRTSMWGPWWLWISGGTGRGRSTHRLGRRPGIDRRDARNLISSVKDGSSGVTAGSAKAHGLNRHCRNLLR